MTFVWQIASCVLLTIFFTGCARFRPLPPSPRVSILPVSLTGGVEVAAQYAHSTTPRMGCNTAEIYLENHGTNPIVFQSASLNGEELPPMRQKTAVSRLETVTLDGESIPLVETELPPDREVVWWQFYPSPELKPGKTIVCQINFRGVPTSQRRLELRTADDDSSIEKSDSQIANQKSATSPRQAGVSGPLAADGEIRNIVVPRFRQPELLITAITFPVDYSKVYIQYQSKHVPPVKLWLNNHEVIGFTVLQSPEPDAPDMVMIPLNSDPTIPSMFPIVTGMPLHVKLQFPDGSERQALVRAQSGITLDAWFRQKPSEKEMEELGLDRKPAIDLMEGFDVACHDTKKKDKGSCAPAVVAERLKLYKEQPNPQTSDQTIQNSLSGLGYCTAIYPELWNIYGQIADAVYAKPYRLWRGRNATRFIDEEDDCIEKARLSAMPRPFMWIPERFNFSGRYIEPDEMEVLAWVALARGGKGIRYHFWMNPGPDPFADCPLLLERLKAINQIITRKREDLSLLAMETEKIIEFKTEPATFIKIYQAWVGEKGVFVMVRNLNYKTDAQSDNKGREPRFRVDVKENVNVNVELPQWLAYRDVRDFITDKKIPCRQEGQRVIVQLPRLEAYRLLWISNGKIR